MATKKRKIINKIQIVGNICEETYADFSARLTEFEVAGVKHVIVELSSAGGSAYDAIAFFSRMRISSCHITVVAFGLVASAAVLVLAGGDHRVMTTECWVMVHEDSIHKLSANVSKVEACAKHMRNMEIQWDKLLAGVSTLSAEGWDKLHKAETYLTPARCLEFGLIEEIV